MTTPITPEQVDNIKLWYDALRSGKYEPISPPLLAYFHEGCCCAAGVGIKVLGLFDNYRRAPLFRELVSDYVCVEVQRGFEFHKWSFTDCANFLHNHMLETYAVDLDDWPESAVAPEVAPKAAAQ